jgi:hypothetical protein
MLELIIFVIATILYFVGKYFITNKAYFRILIGAYITVILVSQFFVNISHISSMCVGQNNLGLATWVTLIPWFIIFGSVVVLLQIYPGWKQPFSNTFGYGVVKLMGINTILNDLFEKAKASGGSLSENLLNKIYNNPSLLINQFTPDNFDNAVKKVFGTGLSATSDEMIKFKNLIKLKDYVSEFVWYILSGILVTTVSYNTIATTSCSNSVSEMKKRHDDYEKEIKEKITAEKTAPAPRQYYIRD